MDINLSPRVRREPAFRNLQDPGLMRQRFLPREGDAVIIRFDVLTDIRTGTYTRQRETYEGVFVGMSYGKFCFEDNKGKLSYFSNTDRVKLFFEKG